MIENSFTQNTGSCILDTKRSSKSMPHINSFKMCIDHSVESSDRGNAFIHLHDMSNGDLMTISYSNVSSSDLQYSVYIEMEDNSFISETITAVLTNNWFRRVSESAVIWKQ